MIDWNEVGYPGTSVFDGMTAAANWNTRALANVDAVNKLREWHLDTNLRNMMRTYQEDEAATALALGKSANEDLRTLDKFRKGLYNSNTGYLDALNAMNPLDGTAVRRLSKDGKNIETVRMDGTVIGTTPNRTGKDAENALLFNYGLGLGHAKANWMNREATRQSIELALAQAQNKGSSSMDELMMRLMLGLSASGGRGGRGGRGRAGGGFGGIDDLWGDESIDWARVREEMDARILPLYGGVLGVDGKMDTTGVNMQDYLNGRRIYENLFQRYVDMGMPLYRAFYTAEQELSNILARQNAAATAPDPTRGRVIRPPLDTAKWGNPNLLTPATPLGVNH